MNFENEQLFREQLPRIKQIRLIELEKNYLKVMYLNRMIFALILLSLTGILLALDLIKIPVSFKLLIAIFLGIIILLYLLFAKKAFKIKSYGLRQRDIIYRSGLIFRSTTIIPFNRVQHIEIKTGPLDRLFGLSSLKVYTAGGSQSDLSIPGLLPETAKRIKEVIISKTHADEEE